MIDNGLKKRRDFHILIYFRGERNGTIGGVFALDFNEAIPSYEQKIRARQIVGGKPNE